MLCPSLVLALWSAVPVASPGTVKPVVAVAPFTTASCEEYHWLGLGLAEMLLSRLGRSPDLLVMNIRQWGAVLRERDQTIIQIDNDPAAVTVARSLGAKLVVRGTYAAKWPELRVQVRVLDVATGALLKESTLVRMMEDAIKLDDALAKPVVDVLGVAMPRSGMMTRNVYAWREVTLCREILSWQSISPRARPVLPLAAIRDAENHCAAALELEAGSLAAKEGLGLARALAGDAKGALQLLKAVREARGCPDMADVAIAWVRFRSGEREDAIKGLQEAVTRRPGFLHARGVLGQALNETRRHADAEREYRTYLSMAPGQPWALGQLGYSLARQGRMEEAMGATQQAITAAPLDITFLIELASRQIDANQLDGAEATLRRALEVDPRAAIAYLRLGYVFLLRDNRVMARPILEKARVEADLEAEWRIRGIALLDLAKLEVRGGNKKAALEFLSKAVAEGLSEPERMEDDVDLAVLKTDKDFQALVTRCREQRNTLIWSAPEGVQDKQP